MLSEAEAKDQLREVLKTKSIFYGDFTLASGAKSKYYVDCRLTTVDAKGAWLVGQCMHALIRRVSRELNVNPVGLGGLTMGADPIALSTSMFSYQAKDNPPLNTFMVRKAPKSHGQTKLIEGNFKAGDTVVVIDDVVTKGESTITALNAVVNEGGKVAFVAVLVDRQQGGRQKIEEMGYKVFPIFTKDELIDPARI